MSGGVPGRDYVGVGVGALVFDAQGLMFLAQRGRAATNERGYWEFPGGKVAFGETLEAAIRREFQEEYGMEIELVALLGVSDHILVAERQHWVSPTYLARHSAAHRRFASRRSVPLSAGSRWIPCRSRSRR